jgi:hypothetical protein
MVNNRAVAATAAFARSVSRAGSDRPRTEATPAWAWDLIHGRGLALQDAARRMSIHRSEVLRLVAAHKPVADGMRMRLMSMAPEPRLDQVAVDIRDHFRGLGIVAGCRRPAKFFWEDGRAEATVREIDIDGGLAHYVDRSTLWIWGADESGDDMVQASACGIEALEEAGFRILDGWLAENGRARTLKGAISIVARRVKERCLVE